MEIIYSYLNKTLFSEFIHPGVTKKANLSWMDCIQSNNKGNFGLIAQTKVVASFTL